MKALIIEDEILVAKDLKKLISDVSPDLEILDIVCSVEDAITWLKSNVMPDIMFLDIQLNDGTSFEIFDQIEIKCPVIFTTAYNEFAIRAFKVNSIDYLLKPIDKKDLTIAMDKFRQLNFASIDSLNAELKVMLSQIANPNSKPIFKERFLARQGKMTLIVPQEKVVYFCKESLIYIATSDKQQLITDFNTMESLAELLNPKIFFRANRQTILNINFIESYRSDSFGKLSVKLKNFESNIIDISREKAQAFKLWLGV